MENLDSIIKSFRMQRHEFMNILQVISGHIQLNNKNEALKYVEKISYNNYIISLIYSLGDNYFAFAFETILNEISLSNIDIKLDIEIGNFYENYFKIDFEKKSNLLKILIMDILTLENKKLHMYIYENDEGQSIILCNSEKIIDEYDEYEEELWILQGNYRLSNIDIYSFKKEGCLGYRLKLKYSSEVR